MFVPNHHGCFLLKAPQFKQLEAITNRADAPFVGVQKIDGPVLGFLPVVPERTSDLELQRPVPAKEEIWRPLRGNEAVISVELV
jgi:hypothetical protein